MKKLLMLLALINTSICFASSEDIPVTPASLVTSVVRFAEPEAGASSCVHPTCDSTDVLAACSADSRVPDIDAMSEESRLTLTDLYSVITHNGADPDVFCDRFATELNLSKAVWTLDGRQVISCQEFVDAFVRWISIKRDFNLEPLPFAMKTHYEEVYHDFYKKFRSGFKPLAGIVFSSELSRVVKILIEG